jgi:hypothetical protein
MSFRVEVARLRLNTAAGALLAVVLVVPSAARTSCGDYATSHPQQPRSSSLVPVSNTQHDPVDGPVPDLPWQTPCHEPQCGPSQPVSQIVVPPTVQQVDQWAWLSAVQAPVCLTEFGLLIKPALVPLARHPSPIYHPPH